MRAAHIARASLLFVALGGACGDGVAATTGGSTGSTSTGTTSTTGVPSSSDDGGTTTGIPTTSDSATTGVLTGSESSGGGTTGTSTTSTTSGDTSTSGPDTAGGSTTGAGDTTGEAGSTSTGESSSGDVSSSGDESSSTGDPDTGGGVEIYGYLGMSGSNTLVRFDTESGVVVPPAKSLLPRANYPYDMEIKPDGSEVWVVGASGNGVVIADVMTGEITHEIDLTGVGKYAVDVVFNVAGTLAYVSARDSKAIVVIDAATYTVKSTVPLGIYDGGKMAFDPCSGRIFMVDWFDKSLLVVEPTLKKVTPIVLGTSLWDLALDPVTKLLYVLDRGVSKVHIFDTDIMQFQSSFAVGKDPWGIDITIDGHLLVVACEDDHTVRFIDTDTLMSATLILPADAHPRDIAIHPDQLRAFVPTGEVAGEDGVYEVDLVTQLLTATISVGPANLNSNVVAVRAQAVECP